MQSWTVKAKKILDSLIAREDELFEMANFHSKTTGVPHVLWFSGDPETKHNRPRGKVRIEGVYYPFSLDEPVEWLVQPPSEVSAKDFSAIARFVRLNRDALLAYWNGEIDTRDLALKIRSIR